MGMPISVHVRGSLARDPSMDAVTAQVFAGLRRAEAVFSTYRPDSDISRMARGEIGLDGAHPDVAEVARLCRIARERTDGWFDAEAPLPGGGTRFDPTGLVKGWATERAAGVLAAVPDHDFCLNAGGDVIAGSHRADTPPWRIGIEDPADRGRLIDVTSLRTGAVATSGTAARGTHIYDPRTGRPAVGLASVTLAGPSLLWADVYATAGFARGPDATRWLSGLTGWSALVVTADGEVTRIRWAVTVTP
jgi:thiamine biosynthesis lipoprotein